MRLPRSEYGVDRFRGFTFHENRLYIFFIQVSLYSSHLFILLVKRLRGE